MLPEDYPEPLTPAAGGDGEAAYLRHAEDFLQRNHIKRDPSPLARLLALVSKNAYEIGVLKATTRMLEVQHITEHPEVPLRLITALQRPIDKRGNPSTAHIEVHDLPITVTASTDGTGTPWPRSRVIWMQLRETVSKIAAQDYCAYVIAPLPTEISAVVWTDSEGRTINLMPPRG